MSEMTPEPIMKIAVGYIAAKHLLIANEIGLFEKLARGSLTLEALAERMVVPSRTTRMVADAWLPSVCSSVGEITITTPRSLQPSSAGPPATGYARSCAS